MFGTTPVLPRSVSWGGQMGYSISIGSKRIRR
jgi:hypothetical protein